MGETSEYFTDWNESYESFDQMGLHENLLRGIYAYGASRWPCSSGARRLALELQRRCTAGNGTSKPLHPANASRGAPSAGGSVARAARHACQARRCTDASGALLRPAPPPFLHPAGFEKPSAIQQKGIVPFGKGLDVIQQAQSGTGKTATFCAGILQVGAAVLCYTSAPAGACVCPLSVHAPLHAAGPRNLCCTSARLCGRLAAMASGRRAALRCTLERGRQRGQPSTQFVGQRAWSRTGRLPSAVRALAKASREAGAGAAAHCSTRHSLGSSSGAAVPQNMTGQQNASLCCATSSGLWAVKMEIPASQTQRGHTASS